MKLSVVFTPDLITFTGTDFAIIGINGLYWSMKFSDWHKQRFIWSRSLRRRKTEMGLQREDRTDWEWLRLPVITPSNVRSCTNKVTGWQRDSDLMMAFSGVISSISERQGCMRTEWTLTAVASPSGGQIVIKWHLKHQRGGFLLGQHSLMHMWKCALEIMSHYSHLFSLDQLPLGFYTNCCDSCLCPEAKWQGAEIISDRYNAALSPMGLATAVCCRGWEEWPPLLESAAACCSSCTSDQWVTGLHPGQGEVLAPSVWDIGTVGVTCETPDHLQSIKQAAMKLPAHPGVKEPQASPESDLSSGPDGERGRVLQVISPAATHVLQSLPNAGFYVF